ncbi:MAG: HAMP domain-containing protein [Gammaproteobacteria bacterium]|nr:HAMP domain-containing protein [Gammaproteobacteria bacterium]
MSRLAWRIFLTIFLTLLATGLGAIVITSWYLEQRSSRSAMELTAGAESAAKALATGGRLGLTDWARQQAADRDSLLIFLVVDEWGDELLERPIPRRGSAVESNAVESSPAASTAAGSNAEPLLGGSVVTLDLPSNMPILSGVDGQRYLLMTLPRDGRRGVFGLPATRLSLLALALLVTAVASYWLAGSITRPIIDLKRTAEALSSGKLNARVTLASLQRRDELGELAHTFDQMADRLGAALQAKEQLLRDVSHELRSPLTRMRLAAALLRRRADPPPEVDRLELDIARLDELIEDILSISRLQSEPSSLHKETLDLRYLLERIATDADFEAKEKHRRIEWQVGETPCMLSLDPQWAAAAIENVVRNALRYTRPESAVVISLGQNAQEACVTVCDAGPGVPEDQLAQIFEPFYRVERDRGRASGGTGLGLAIAARVLGAHGGRIEARNLPAPSGGLMIRMWWPKHQA